MGELELQKIIGSEVQITSPKSGAITLTISLGLFIIWVVFASLYASRVAATLLSFLINRYMRLKKLGGSLSIGSISVSPLAGKLVFRRVIYACEDWSFRVNDGVIILSYWKFIPNTRAAKSCTSRLSICLNGLQLHVYNQLHRYREIAKLIRQSNLLPEEVKVDASQVDGDDVILEKLWNMIGMLRVEVPSGRIVMGNALLPYMMVLSFENVVSKIILEDSTHDKRLMNVKTDMENVRASLMKHAEYAGPPVPEPPRKMGDAFVVMQTSQLSLFYFQDILGREAMDEQSPIERRPVWESIWRLGHSTQFTYGPWAEKQRNNLINFFLPPLMNVAPVTEWPKKGQRRISVLHEARVNLLHEASLDICFVRGEEMDNVTSTLKPGSSLDMMVWWITTEEGFKWTAKAALLNMETSTSLLLSPFLSAETFSFEITALYPRVANARQTWNSSCLLSKASMHFVAEHIPFLAELSSQWMGNDAADLCTFFPYVLGIDLQVQDFEIILLTNEGNWLERTVSEENWKMAVVGQSLSMNVVLPFDDFAPQMTKLSFDVRLRGECAVRSNLPPSRTSTAMMGSLMVAAPQMNAPPSRFGVTSKGDKRGNDRRKEDEGKGKGEEWVEIWRTEGVDVLLQYSYHPIQGEFKSELPLDILSSWLPPPVTHPFKLEPDTMTVSVDVHSSELLASGILIRQIINFIENYCSSYDKLTDVGGGTEGETKTSFTRATFPVEKVRPLTVTFALRLHHVRAFCLSHATEGGSAPQIILEQLEVEVDKNFERSLIQVTVGSCAARIAGDGSSSGVVSLSSLQIRGHALFSPLGVPLDMASLEYSWTLQVLIGDVFASLNTAQLVHVAEMVHSLITHITLEDDKKRIPEKLVRCHHGELSVSCSRKGSHHRCATDQDVQFRLIRISVDTIQALVMDENDSILMDMISLRIHVCNWEDLHVGLSLHSFSCRLLVAGMGDQWLEVASTILKRAHLIVKLAEKEEWNGKERKEWVGRHDEATTRLPFVKEKRNEGECIACTGGHSFFLSKDIVGLHWNDGEYKMAIVGDRLVGEGRIQHGESLLKRGNYACQSVPRAVYMTRKVTKKTSSSSSASSFHSFSNETRVEWMKAHSGLVPSWKLKTPGEGFPDLGLKGEIDEWRKRHALNISKTYNGIGEGRLIPMDMEGVEQTAIDEEKEGEEKVIGVQGRMADELFMRMTPLGVEVINELMEAIVRTAKSTRMTYDIETMLSSCADRHHKQPLLQKWIQYPETPPLDIVVKVSLSNVCLSLLCASSPSTASSLLLSIEETQLTTKRDSSRSEFILSPRGVFSQVLTIHRGRSLPNQSILRDGVHSVAEWRNKMDGEFFPRVIFDIWIPSPVVTLNLPLKKDDMKLLQMELQRIEGTCVVEESGKGDAVFSLLAPTVTMWSQSIGEAMIRIPKCVDELKMQREWLLIRLLVESSAKTESLLKKTFKGEMHSIRAHQGLIACGSCSLALALLRDCSYNHMETEDLSQLPSTPSIRNRAMISALKTWQKPLSNLVIMPKDVDLKMFECEGGDKREKETSDAYHKGGGGGGDNTLYSHLSHRLNKRDKKKKDKENNSSCKFDPHVFFFSWYEKLHLDATPFDTLSSMRVKTKLTLKSLQIRVMEHRKDLSGGCTFVPNAVHSLVALEHFSTCIDVSLSLERDDRLHLPSHADLTLRNESHIQSVCVSFVPCTCSLIGELISLGEEIEGALKKGKKKREERLRRVLTENRPPWVVELLKKVEGEGGGKEERMTRMTMEVNGSGGIVVEEVKGHAELYKIKGTLKIENTKVQVHTGWKQRADEIEMGVDGETRKVTLMLEENRTRQVTRQLLTMTLSDIKPVLKKKQGVKGEMTLKMGSLMGEVEIGLIEGMMKCMKEMEKRMEWNVKRRRNRQENENEGGIKKKGGLPECICKMTLNLMEMSCIINVIKATLRLEKMSADGYLGATSRGNLKLEQNVLMMETIQKKKEKMQKLNMHLPSLMALMIWREGDSSIVHPPQGALRLVEGRYLDVSLTIGSLERSFSTDALNMIIYVESVLKVTLTKLMEELSEMDTSTAVAFSPHCAKTHSQSRPDVKEKKRNEPFLFALRIESKGDPWLSLTAATPTNTAVQVRIQHVVMTLTNRWSTSSHRLLGSLKMHLQVRLGHKPSLSPLSELDQFASFSTQLTIERKEGASSTDSFSCLLTRPVAEVNPRGIERAVLLWLHCKTSFHHWSSLHSVTIPQERIIALRESSLRPPSTHDVSLSVAIVGLSVRIPLRADTSLLLLLKSADATVCIKQELALSASFDAFKMTILEGLTHQEMLDFDSYDDNDPRSNFISFPKGTLQLCSSASSPHGSASVKVHISARMSGMVLDADHRIGKLAKALVSAFSQIGELNDEHRGSFSSLQSAIDSSDDDDVFTHLNKLPPDVNKQRWLEEKIRDETELLQTLEELQAPPAKLEEERKVLRQYEQAQLKYFLRKLKGGEVEERGRKMEVGRVEDKKTLDTVKMQIEAALVIESGRCSLHTRAPLSSRQSMKDLGARVTRPSTVSTQTTTMIIPSVSSNGVYKSGIDKERGSLHLRLSLDAIPQPQVFTPHIAHFVEQVLEPLPASWLRVEEGIEKERSSPESPLIDTSLPFDLIVVLNVHSSQIEFRGQQQNTSAADCRLQLPSLSLVVSSRILPDKGVCLDLSASLSQFSLSIFSPHQTSSHDALKLSLDHLAFVISRSKNASVEAENRVQLVLTASIGRGAFNYDMRRLSELVAFPKPWYRPAVARRLFFGDKYMQPRNMGMERISRPEKPWTAKVVMGLRWRELEVKAHMGNTMSNTNWRVKKGETRAILKMTSQGDMNIDATLCLEGSELSASGGAISGIVSLNGLIAKLSHTRTRNSNPTNKASLELKELSCKLDWMTRPILVAETRCACLSFTDLWSHARDESGLVKEAVVSSCVSLSWKNLQLVITRTTVSDLEKMANKLVSFFQKQLESSRMVWEATVTETLGDTRREGPMEERKDGEKKEESPGIWHWQTLLDMLITLQCRNLIPFVSGTGPTYLKGRVLLEGESFSLACMMGEMNALLWALFHLRLPSLHFSTLAKFGFQGEANNKKLTRHVKQRAVITVGKTVAKSDRQGSVCRVQSKTGGTRTQENTRVSAMLDEIIGDALRQIGHVEVNGQKAASSVLELFQFPALEAVMESKQEEETEPQEGIENIREVQSSFVSQFFGVLSVLTQLDAQLGFLPDLIKSYVKSTQETQTQLTEKEKKPKVESTPKEKDTRVHKCIEWEVKPRIAFIDKVRWEPPVVDDLLRMLQIFDHRNTMPKQLQRALLDPLDKASASILLKILKLARTVSEPLPAPVHNPL